MKRLALVLLALPLLLGAGWCGGGDSKCQLAKEAEKLACQNPESNECKAARAAVEIACVAPTPTVPPPTTTAPPSPTPTPSPAPTPTPEAECSLDTPRFDKVAGVRFRIYADGLGFGVTPLGRFGADYCRKAGWTDGRSECAAAPDGHPQRPACERQFIAISCPLWLHYECLGVGQQCPVTFDPYFFNQETGKEEPFPANVSAGCPRDPQDSVEVRAYKVTASGKGRFQVCTGAPGGTQMVCTVGPEIDR